MKVVILAAGMGSRMGGGETPKPLIPLANGHTIMGQQLAMLAGRAAPDDILVVVGYKKDLIMERHPELLFVYNPNFSTENTSQSLLRALRKVDDDLLWLNGDVVLGEGIVDAVLAAGASAMAVQRGLVGEEEVKFRSDGEGRILEVSKQVADGEGEAVGVNFCRREDLPLLRAGLEACGDEDYFERGLELALNDGLDLRAVEIPADACIEVDFIEDLAKANDMVEDWDR
jgi:L-glutamine-phosphate cytidylyltransferase